MALKTYIGPLAAVEVKIAGHQLGIVEKGTARFIPDDLVDLVEWPADHWRDGAPDDGKDAQ